MQKSSQSEGASAKGPRPSNQDAWLARPDLGLYAVADGVGGQPGGAVASALALSTLVEMIQRMGWNPGQLTPLGAQRRLRLVVEMVQRTIVEHSRGDHRRMGTTLAMLWTTKRRAYIAHVGDSRVYRWRDGRLACLTMDHNVAAMVENLEAPPFGFRHHPRALTRALARGCDGQPEIQVVDLRPGDVFLLVTDGVNDGLDDFDIASLLRAHAFAEIPEAVVAEAHAAGATDNATAVVVLPEVEEVSGSQAVTLSP
jgi:serine/threonine protein phosphatase PrpC